ncbi:hypothetical protein HZS_6970 [Henneguya salminicola]|nr:hypothetical protein HZS_6970 [Henneguya salminicola]
MRFRCQANFFEIKRLIDTSSITSIEMSKKISIYSTYLGTRCRAYDLLGRDIIAKKCINEIYKIEKIKTIITELTQLYDMSLIISRMDVNFYFN